MTNSTAFRFIGKISNDTLRCAMNVNSGNAVCACIDAGVALIDMASSIITFSSECNRTDILRKHTYESKILLDTLVSQTRSLNEEEIEKKKLLLISGLKKVKLELQKEYEIVCLDIEAEKKRLIQNIEFERKRNITINKVSLLIRDVLVISTDALEALSINYDKNKTQIACLEEQIRQSTAQYNKIIKILV